MFFMVQNHDAPQKQTSPKDYQKVVYWKTLLSLDTGAKIEKTYRNSKLIDIKSNNF